MLIEARNCTACMKSFAFESSQCSQIIIGQGRPDSKIIFLPRCPHCGVENQVEMPWDEYNIFDF